MAMYFDFRNRRVGGEADILFQGWDLDSESVVVLSPHDDDALLGAGYMMHTMKHLDVPVTIVIFCKGDAGYSTEGMKHTIVETRKRETLAAYAELGFSDVDIVRFDYPDFSLRRRVAWDGPDKENGTFGDVMRLLRRVRATRLFIANGYREHADHTAVFEIGLYDGVQSADAVLVDLGRQTDLRSTHVYSVWADFPPEDALATSRPAGLRANMGMAVEEAVEARIIAALRRYASQDEIIDGLVRMREGKKSDLGWIELYQWIDPRPQLDYSPYIKWLNAICKEGSP